MATLDAVEWTDEEIAAICDIGDWYANILISRGQQVPGHALRAVLRIASEAHVANLERDAMDKEARAASLDVETVAELTADPPTAAEAIAVAGVLASAMAVHAGIVNEADMRQHSAVTVAQILAQVRLRDSTGHLGSGYVQ